MTQINSTTQSSTEKFLDELYNIVPAAFTEVVDSNTGKPRRAVDFDALRQLLGDSTVEGRSERYQFTWAGKREAMADAARPINKTLRPVKDDSVDWDTTKNLYIEGDNLEVLKLLQKSYCGQVKMIYIDPPYNTGNDFVYDDDFSRSSEEEAKAAGDIDEYGVKLRKNPGSNGRFHSDWCSMIYPRLMLARNLLSEDGVIFISISEEEIENMKKICNEIFGEDSFANSFIVRRYDKNLNRQFMDQGLKSFNIGFEYVLCYTNNIFLFKPIFKDASEERSTTGYWKGFWNDADRPTMRYDILGFTPVTGQWKWSKDVATEAVENYKVYIDHFSKNMTLEEYWAKTGKCKKFIRRNPNGKGKNSGVENWIAPADGILRNTNWTDILASKAEQSTRGLFDFPKNVDLIKILLQCATDKDSLILDFFSGSATTAHAVMQLNAEDGGNRRFIMVQIPEETDEKSEAYKAGYKNICEIGKERIRRAGAKIKSEHPEATNLDTGFRVFRVDSSNFADVRINPRMADQLTLDLDIYRDNIKPDRSGLDLISGSLLSWGVPLDEDIKSESIDGEELFIVSDGYLVALFGNKVTDAIMDRIVELEPQRILFRDATFGSDEEKINVYETLKQRLGWNENDAESNIRVL